MVQTQVSDVCRRKTGERCREIALGMLKAAQDTWHPIFVSLRAYSTGAFQQFRENLLFWIGVIALVIPTIMALATHAWDKEQSAHAPIVLATGLWLFAQSYREAAALAAPPRAGWLIAIIAGLVLYAAARVTGLLEIRALAVYLVGVATLYSVGGWPVVRRLWFPIAYLAFLVPIPDSLIEIGTQPIKLAISHAVVWLLSSLSYPVAQSGVSIFIGQYELLIATACSGLNSLISLTAIGSFYVYLRHNSTPGYTLILILAIVPIAVLANFVRVLTLVMLTYYAGESTAQGFLHETSGMFLFVFALVSIFLLDRVLSAVMTKRAAA